MLNIDFNVIKGAIVIHLEGNLNNNTIINLEEKLNYLIYKQEMHFLSLVGDHRYRVIIIFNLSF